MSNMIYTGEIENGQMHGKGALIYPNKEKYEVQRLLHLFSYLWKGDWVQGKRHGIGTYVYADSSRYDGEWVDDKVCYELRVVLRVKPFPRSTVKEPVITQVETNTLDNG